MSEAELVTLCYGRQRMVIGPKDKTTRLAALLEEKGIKADFEIVNV
jgi:hypothetical protein